MRTYLLFALLFIFLTVNAQPDYIPPKFSEWNGKSFPFREWITIDGDTLKQNNFANKVCFFNFFANGCAGCMLEIKYLNRLLKHYSESTDVCIIALYSGDKESYKRFYKSNEIITKASSNSTLQLVSSAVSVPLYDVIAIDPNHFKYKYNAWGIPANMIIDKLGIIRYCGQGFPGDKSDQEEIYYKYISEIEKLR